MEVFIWDVDHFATQHQVVRELARHLHVSPYTTAAPLNFHVQLFKAKGRKRGGGRLHAGNGALTLPSERLGRMFLAEYGDPFPRRSVLIGGRKMKFKLSNRKASKDVLLSIENTPYLDPADLEKRDSVARMLESSPLAFTRLQFGWECRDHNISIEWDYESNPASSLYFDADSRRISIEVSEKTERNRKAAGSGNVSNDLASSIFGLLNDLSLNERHLLEIHVDFANIEYISAHHSAVTNLPVILLFLYTPPQFIQRTLDSMFGETPSSRHSCLPLSDVHGLPHADVAPYTSHIMRLICRSPRDLLTFERHASEAGLNIPVHNLYFPIERRGLFSTSSMSTLSTWLESLDFHAAFQIQRLVLDGCVDPKEMFELRDEVDKLVQDSRLRSSHSLDYMITVLRDFGSKASELFWSANNHQTLKQCFLKVKAHHDRPSASHMISNREDDGIFLCLHVQITPTSMILTGPLPERSNRVIRQYPRSAQRHFLRVSFLDEGRLQLQFNREVNGSDFVQSRIRPFFRKGLKVAGRLFRFLGYSQSALKEHAVYFMSPFRANGELVTCESVIKSLGNFADLPFDSKLMYCPARYAARISQGFTSTDPTTTVVENMVLDLPDIETVDSEGKNWCHTDGVGTMSPDFAKGIHAERQSMRRGRRKPLEEYARALQVRWMGSKGMLSVDHTLSGKTVCLRPSMVKFMGTRTNRIEIAKVFDKPGIMYLNRPLIMLLEGLGVPYESFKKFQDMAVADAEQATQSFDYASYFLQGHGLGTSFRINSVLTSLSKAGISTIPDDSFYQTFMEYGINHVLRMLKHRARIPVPGAWNLVGIADIHRELPPKHIFVCVKPIDEERIYLEGAVLVSRSPTIHPGDIQIVTAIGPPPPGSCFEKDDLANTIVFSTTDERPLPSCLGGGDLDGDEYNVVPLKTLPEFLIKKAEIPGKYPPAERKMLDRPCTMDDVADFVMEYITSDVLGMVSINWRILADQENIFHPNCMKMAELHSLAVDYPKSGNPVPIRDIPRRENRLLPDWYAPETMRAIDRSKYYNSQKAIGRLFRDITLEAPKTVVRLGRAQRKRFGQEQEDVEEELDDIVESFEDLLPASEDHRNPLYEAVEGKVSEYIDIELVDVAEEEEIKNKFQSYRLELESICSANTVSSGKGAMLTEEEAVVGTIVANTSQPKKRLQHISKLREQTEMLVHDVRDSLAGDDSISPGKSLQRAFFAWVLAEHFCGRKEPPFGARSFWWVALGAVFDGIKEIEQENIRQLKRDMSL